MSYFVQFAHSNGFPARSFNYFFSLLEEVDLNYVDKMGHGDFKLDDNLDNLALELIDSIEKRFNHPVIGIGHSTGATLISIAASIKPDLFSHVILIEPILYHPWKRFIISVMRKTGLKNYIGPVKKTLNRKSSFDSKDEALIHFQKRSFFNKLHPECFADYMRHGLEEQASEVTLSFSKNIEANIYRCTYTKKPQKIHQLNGALLYGKHSNMFSHRDVNWWKRTCPHLTFIPIDCGHMVPMEKPELTAQIINDILKKTSR